VIKMSLELRIRDRFAKRLARFVQKERAAAGCAKVAMANVARKVGMSAVAVYRAMNGYGPVKIQAHHRAALIMHSIGIVSAAAKRMGRKRQSASTLHA
jgi:DNA-binding phage protein